MNDIELLLALVAAAVALVWLARVINVPYPALLVVAGLAIGFVPGVPDLVLEESRLESRPFQSPVEVG